MLACPSWCCEVWRQASRLEGPSEALADPATVERHSSLIAEHPWRHLSPPLSEGLRFPFDPEPQECVSKLLAQIHGSASPGLWSLDATNRERTDNSNLMIPEIKIMFLGRDSTTWTRCP